MEFNGLLKFGIDQSSDSRKGQY